MPTLSRFRYEPLLLFLSFLGGAAFAWNELHDRKHVYRFRQLDLVGDGRERRPNARDDDGLDAIDVDPLRVGADGLRVGADDSANGSRDDGEAIDAGRAPESHASATAPAATPLEHANAPVTSEPGIGLVPLAEWRKLKERAAEAKWNRDLTEGIENTAKWWWSGVRQALGAAPEPAEPAHSGGPVPPPSPTAPSPVSPTAPNKQH